MDYVAALLLGILIGYILSGLVRKLTAEPPAADLVFDTAVSENIPYLAVNNEEVLKEIRTKKYVTVKVVRVNSDSHK